MNNLQEPKGQGGNSLIEAIQDSLLTVDKTEEGKPAGWHTMMLRCERIVKELGIKVNNYKVLEEYRRRHPEETKKEEVKDGQEI